MALFYRVSRLLRADLNAVLDHLEEPDVLLRQSLREMREALAGDRARHEELRRELEQLGRRAHELEQALCAIDGELDLCFEAGEHALARALCRRKLETAHLLESVQRRHASTREELSEVDTRCREQQQQLDALSQHAELVTGESCEGPEASTQAPRVHVDHDAIEIAFLREQRKRSAS